MGYDYDYVSMDVVGTVTTDPKRKGKDCYFDIENRRGKSISTFHVIARNGKPLNVKKDDRVFITKAGFFVRANENAIVLVEGSGIDVVQICSESDTEKFDYIAMDVVGTVITNPVRKGKNYFFDMENRRGKSVSKLHVIVRDERPIDVNKDDRVFIAKAGFFVRAGENNVAVVERSNIEVIRIRCNLGIEEV